MGLEGSELVEKMEVFDSLRWNHPQGPNPMSVTGLDSCTSGDLLCDDPNAQLLRQVSLKYFWIMQCFSLIEICCFNPETPSDILYCCGIRGLGEAMLK